MARVTSTEKSDVERKNISASVEKPLFDALEDHRWDERKKMSEIVVTALTEYAAKRNLSVKPSQEVPGQEALSPKA